MKFRKYALKAWMYFYYGWLKIWLGSSVGRAGNKGIDLPEIQGRMPTACGAPLLVFAAADGIYFEKFGAAFIGALAEHADQVSVHIHLFNPARAQLDFLDGLVDRADGLQLSFTWEDVNLQDLHGEEKGRYYYSVRFVRFAQVFESAKTDALCLDIDTLLVRPVSELLAVVKEADIAFYSRFSRFGIDTKLLAGTLYVRFRPLPQRFLAQVGHQIERFVSCGRLLSKLDQIIIYDNFLKMRKREPGLRFQSFDDRVIDTQFSDEGVIWYPKGGTKLDGEYENRSRRYRDGLSG